jgi:hypothetical protein
MGSKVDPGFQDIPNEQENRYLVNAAAHVPGIANEKVVAYYDSWATKYDQVRFLVD